MSLEDKVNDKESKGFMKKALKLGWNIGIAAATTAFSLAAIGTTGVIVGGALGAGALIGSMISKKSFYNSVNEGLKAYSVVNVVLYPLVVLGNATFPLIPNETLMGKIARTAYAATLYNMAFVGSYRATDHLIENYLNPAGITKTISHNFINASNRVGWGFLPGYALFANDVPKMLGIPWFALNALPFGIYNAANPLPDPKKRASYTPSYSPAPAGAH